MRVRESKTLQRSLGLFLSCSRRLIRGEFGIGAAPCFMFEDQTEEQFFEIVLAVAVSELGQRAFRENVAAVNDRQTIAEALRFAHDVRAKDDALALLAELDNDF